MRTLLTIPSETRIGGEYVKDAAHFHLGYDASKNTANFGTRGFFYDAYGNVIGMKDAADVSKYGVIDKAWIEYSKGVASPAPPTFVGLDAKVTEDVVVASVKYGDVGDTTVEDIVPDAPEALKKLYELTVADFVSYLPNTQNFKSFYMVYDLLGKFRNQYQGQYTLSRLEDVTIPALVKLPS